MFTGHECVACELVHVRAADRDRADLQQHVGVADLGHGNLAQLDGQRLERVLHDGLLARTCRCVSVDASG